MDLAPDVAKCANPACDADFLKLGQGSLTVFTVAEPGPVGLPQHTHQKVVWLCARCSEHKYVHYDRERNRIRVLEAPHRRRQRAA